jgi:CBS domain containing-hemolysin-like protein
MRPPLFVSELTLADELLRELQRNKVHIAIVYERFGGTAGLVTMENLLEEIVGDIRDEYDENETADIQQLSDTEFIVDAVTSLGDVEDQLEINLDDENSDTLGGFIFTHLERLPEPDEVIELDNVTMKVLNVEGRRIRMVHVTVTDTNETQAPTADTDTEEATDNTELAS